MVGEQLAHLYPVIPQGGFPRPAIIPAVEEERDRTLHMAASHSHDVDTQIARPNGNGVKGG